MPQQLWTETVPNLWQGGTLDRWADQEWFDQAATNGTKITPEHFDSVFTLYADAEPVDWFVKEVRLGFYDSAMGDFNPETELEDVVKMAHKDWKSGNTEVTNIDGVSYVYLHGNKIAEVGDSFIRLFDGGYQSNTTKSRLNAILFEHGIAGECVFQKNWNWFLRSKWGTEFSVIPFFSSMRLA
jgi:hypothetical protein